MSIWATLTYAASPIAILRPNERLLSSELFLSTLSSEDKLVTHREKQPKASAVLLMTIDLGTTL